MDTALPVEMKVRHNFVPSWSTAAALGLPLCLGLALRLYALKRLFLAIGDSLIYGDIARNLMLHGQYGLTVGPHQIAPTLIRLPGYPYLLVLCFRLFGMENYAAACWMQIALELIGCLLLADFARRIAPARLARRSALATLWLACLCPFTASYTAAPLAETPTLFAIALALWSAALFRQRPGWWPALSFTFAITFAALLRPDGALVAVALAPATLLGLPRTAIRRGHLACIAVVCTLLTLAPFAAWTARNWVTLRVMQPLAPRLAVDPGEDPHLGWEAWIKSWCLDFNCTYFTYWSVPGEEFDLEKLPTWAFDSPAQQAATAALVDDYNQHYLLTKPLDRRFAALAAERLQTHPWRTRIGMPLGRLANMWFSPRTENLPIDLRWWEYAQHRAETCFCWAWMALNLLYIALAIAGLRQRPRLAWAMVAYIVLRSLMLLSVQAPESRYTLECFPMLFVLGGVALAAGWQRLARRQVAQGAAIS